MKEFTSALEDLVIEDEREEKIALLMTEGMSRDEAEAEVDDGKYVAFMLDGHELRAYPPTDGQLAFMLASLGRGQTKDGRFAAIINVMLASLRDDDKDYLENRLLSRDPRKRVSMKQIEGIFEYLTEEWFRPTVSGGGAAVPDRR